MTNPFILAVLVAVAVAVGVVIPEQPAFAADECASSPVSARGEPATFEWLAKTKALANWRSRVRRTKALGQAYSTWSRAENRDERCTPKARGIACTFTGTPCRR